MVYGDDGQTYLDWVSALGANLLGYGDMGFAEAVKHQVQYGTGYSLPSFLEQRTAERLVYVLGKHVPNWAPDTLSVRFGLSGSDACSMAVRLARAVTGHERIVSVGYHGWGSEFIAASPPAWGVPSQSVTAIPFGDGDALAEELTRIDYGVACVIIEQPPQVALEGYWGWVQRLCRDCGALLILDEVVTGLRFGRGGAAGEFGITPDIMCMGKGLGNGVPVSAMVFRREYASWFARQDPVFVSSTHFGCTLGLAAADYILSHWTQGDADYLWRLGTALADGLREIGYDVAGYPPVSLIKEPDPSRRAYMIAGMRDRGILMNRPSIPCRAHTPADMERTLDAAREVWAEMAATDVGADMAGRLPEGLFANR